MKLPALTWHQKHEQSLTAGERFADTIALFMGSWKFIILQTVFVVMWMILNVIALVQHWDPYPFILLNLIFSTQAAYAAPIIMMSQNRAADRDRTQALEDFDTNLKAKSEIESIQQELARIENDKLDAILAILRK